MGVALRDEIARAIRCGPAISPRDWRTLPKAMLTRAERVLRFIEDYVRVPEGKDVGKKLRLDEFQEAFIYSIYDNKQIKERIQDELEPRDLLLRGIVRN